MIRDGEDAVSQPQASVNVARRPSRTQFFLWTAFAALAAAMIGFFTTFTRPVWRGEFHGPSVAYVHGAFVLSWLLLFLAQASLVKARSVARHRMLGWLGVAIVPGVVLTTWAMGVSALRRDLAAGGGEIAYSSLVGTFTSPMVFALLFVAAIAYRKRPDFHKRLMFLAMFAVMWPAFFRFRHYFPPIDHPEVWFGYVLAQVVPVGVAMLHDRFTLGRVHRVYLTFGLAMLAEAAIELMLFDTAAWRVVAHGLAGFFL
jgi:hypothetical protein